MESDKLQDSNNNDHNQLTQVSNHSQKLVSLFDMFLVVCTDCHKKHYSAFESRPFVGEGSCQCLHPDSTETDISCFTLWADLKSKISGEVVSGCYYCFDADQYQFIRFSPPKTKTPHVCKAETKRKPKSNHFGWSKHALFNSKEGDLLTLKKGQDFTKYMDYSLSDIRKYPFGSHFFFERICNTLSTKKLVDLRETNNFDDAINNFIYLKTFAESYFITTNSKKQFATLLNYNYRNAMAMMLRLRLHKIAKNKDLDRIIFRTIVEVFREYDVSSIIFLLEENRVLKVAKSIIRRMLSEAKNSDELWDEPQKKNLIYILLVRVMDVSKNKDTHDNSEALFKFQHILLQLIRFNNKFFEMLSDISEIQDVIESTYPVAEVNLELTNRQVLVESSLRIQYTVSASTYGEMSVPDVLNSLQKEFQIMKKAFNVTFNVEDCTSYNNKYEKNEKFTVQDKIKLLLTSQVVHTLVFAYEFYLQFYYDMYWYSFKDYNAQYFSNFYSLLSILGELSNECFEISVLCLDNFGSPIKLNNAGIADKAQQLFALIFTELMKNIPSSLKLKQIILDLNLDPSLRTAINEEYFEKKDDYSLDSFDEDFDDSFDDYESEKGERIQKMEVQARMVESVGFGPVAVCSKEFYVNIDEAENIVRILEEIKNANIEEQIKAIVEESKYRTEKIIENTERIGEISGKDSEAHELKEFQNVGNILDEIFRNADHLIAILSDIAVSEGQNKNMLVEEAVKIANRLRDISAEGVKEQGIVELILTEKRVQQEKYLEEQAKQREEQAKQEEAAVKIVTAKEVSIKEVKEEPKSKLQEYIFNFIEVLEQRGTRNGNLSLDEGMNLFTSMDIAEQLRYHTYIQKTLRSGLKFSFDKNYLTKQMADPSLIIPELFSKTDMVTLTKNESLSKQAKLTLLAYFLNSCGEISLTSFSRNILKSIFKYSVIPKENIPVNMDYEFKNNKNSIKFSYQTNITKNIDYLLEEYFYLVREQIREESDFAEQVNNFKKAAIIARRFKFQLTGTGIMENFKEAYRLIVDKILASDSVIFEKEETNFTIENLIRFKNKKDKIKFEFTVEKAHETDIFYNFENIVLLSSLNEKKIKETFNNQGIVKILRNLDLDGYKRCAETLFSQIHDFSFESIPTTLDILLNLLEVSKSPHAVFYNETKPFFARIMGFFFYCAVEYLSTFCYAEFKYLNQAYYNIIMKILRIIKTLTDYNSMHNRKFLSNVEFSIFFNLKLGEKVTIFEKNEKMNLFDICNIFINGFVQGLAIEENDSSFAYFRANEIVDLIEKILEVNSEILEGNSAENINKYLRKVENMFLILKEKKENDTIRRLLNVAQKFYMKLFSELNINDEGKNIINSILSPSRLLKQIKSLDTFSGETAQAVTEGGEEGVKMLLDYYYNDEERLFYSSEEIRNAFQAFVYFEFENSEGYKPPEIEEDEDIKLFFKFFRKVIKKVEISVEGTSKNIYFLQNPEYNLFRRDREILFFNEVDRSSSDKKKEELVEYARYFRKDIEYIKENELSKGWKKIITQIPYKAIVFCLLLLSVINILLIINMTSEETNELTNNGSNAFYVIVIVQLAISWVILALWLFVKFPLALNLEMMRFKTRNSIEEHSTLDVVRSSATVLQSNGEATALIMMVLTSIITLSHSSLYWVVSFQLLYFSNFSTNLMNVIFAVRMRARQLLLVSLFMVFLLVIYALMTFVYMSDRFETEDGDKLCLTPAHCLVNQFDFGLRMGGGMGDNMPVVEWGAQSFWSKFFYSSAHFLIFPVVMLNIVSGIIIDTFGDLREKTSELEFDKKNVCLICGKQKSVINREEGLFKVHVAKTHRITDYMFFVMDIEAMRPDETDYYQAYVKKKIEDEDVTWIPDGDREEDENILKTEAALGENIDEMVRTVRAAANVKRSQLNKLFESTIDKAINKVKETEDSYEEDEETEFDDKNLQKMTEHFTTEKVKSWLFN